VKGKRMDLSFSSFEVLIIERNRRRRVRQKESVNSKDGMSLLMI